MPWSGTGVLDAGRNASELDLRVKSRFFCIACLGTWHLDTLWNKNKSVEEM